MDGRAQNFFTSSDARTRVMAIDAASLIRTLIDCTGPPPTRSELLEPSPLWRHADARPAETGRAR
jgi:hypothetical protein